MDCAKSGHLIAALRKEKGLTQQNSTHMLDAKLYLYCVKHGLAVYSIPFSG